MARPEFELAVDMPGIQEPAALPAIEAGEMGDREPIVGVSAGGRHRAYLVAALAKGPMSHIVNDVVGGVPVSVTHCDIHLCTRVFTGGVPGEPLDLAQGGLKAGSMVLRSGGHRYRQDSYAPLEAESPAFPYDAYPGDVTTWGAWRQRFPDTDVYLGDVSSSPPPEPGVARASERWRPMPSTWPALLGDLLFVGAVPLLILFVTLLVHILTALFLSQPGGTSLARAPAATEGIRVLAQTIPSPLSIPAVIPTT